MDCCLQQLKKVAAVKCSTSPQQASSKVLTAVRSASYICLHAADVLPAESTAGSLKGMLRPMMVFRHLTGHIQPHQAGRGEGQVSQPAMQQALRCSLSL